MAYPRHQLSRQFKKKTLTSGDITLNQTAVTNVSTALDITLDAQVGDEIEYNISGLLSNINQTVCFDVYSVVSSATVNPFGAGLSASLASTQGVQGWFQGNDGLYARLNGGAIHTVIAGDLDTNGRITLRLQYAKVSATARTLYANTNNPLTVWAKNLGPSDDD